jgi:D-alanyl-D-alanine carboxypeptidase (penicillin-binding protein 5/6)
MPNMARAFLTRTLTACGLIAALAGALGATGADAATIDTTARQAFMIDASTGTVLLEKNADERMPTSSMSKVMTMYMVFDRLKSGRLSLDDTMPVSEHAWRTQGSKMFVELGNNIKVEDLIRGVIVQSGNDAAVVLAEGLAGTEDAFAAAATKRAHEMGMANSNFVNADGMPDDNHYSTARDLATLADHLIKDYPEYYHYFAELDFTYHGIKQGNRNPLLYRNMGVDGVKTGHTEKAGFGLIASGQRNGRRLILVVNGLGSMQERADEPARLLEWGFREFDTYALLKGGETVDTVPVWMGSADQVPVTVEKDIALTLNRDQRRGMKVTVKGDGAVEAPVAKGAKVATLTITAPDFTTLEVPLVAAQDVPRLGVLGRIGMAAHHFVFGS